MPFYADLHVHSKYSRATSRDLDLEHLTSWAARKGITVVGTGDAVHPGWRAEIGEKLIEADGLYRLSAEREAAVLAALPPSCRAPVRFLLSVEISTIYKKDDRTRKVHHLILIPDFAAADRLAAALAKIGNIAADGRPILGLDSRDLLEITLEAGCDLIPAHIWTPWFSALGALSGFDSVADCYGDLANHIFAVETGLSSDPAMNWRVSSLDRYRLVSHSDAHSPAKLGREATLYSCDPSYAAIRRALKDGDGYGGTVEFFPEEGKYHLDGHRACAVRLDPKETLAHGGLCPVCGRPVTVGVAHRVELLADRAAPVRPATAGSVQSLVPLPEILSELTGVGVASHKVEEAYARTTGLGNELALLTEVPLEDITAFDSRLGEAIARLRAGTTFREGGYDGEYGTIRLFSPEEREQFAAGDLLFAAPRMAKPAHRAKAPAPQQVLQEKYRQPVASGITGALAALDADQAAAAASLGPLVVTAGPGAGKTRLIVHRLAHLIATRGAAAERCLTVTFTRRATEELKARIAALLPSCAAPVHSFHSLGLAILKDGGATVGLAEGWRVAGDDERCAVLTAALGVSTKVAASLLQQVSRAKRSGEARADEVLAACAALEEAGHVAGWIDFDDLILLAVEALQKDAALAARWRFDHVLADEFQDIDPGQYRLLQLVCTGDLCVIGDADQAIYGFRGADQGCFARFGADHPLSLRLSLMRNYRSTDAIITASGALMGRMPDPASDIPRAGVRAEGEAVLLHGAADERAEADFVAAKIAELMGGHDMLTAERGRALGFSDFAVLYRTDAQGAALCEALDRAAIPHQKSRPDRLIDHAGVTAVLAALKSVEGEDLGGRLALAVALVQATGSVDTAHLAEAQRWLAELAAEFPEDALWREQVALANEADFYDLRAERVSLLTMHAAKGLEFAAVFVIGLEEGLMPLTYAQSEAEIAEEGRLLYVAMTRARDYLMLSYAQERFWQGAVRPRGPSRFLKSLGGLVRRDDTPPSPPKQQQYSLF